MPKAPPFTAQSAREAALRSALVRRAKREALKEAARDAAEAAANPPAIQPAPPPPAYPQQPAESGDAFNLERIGALRAQIRRLDALIAKTTDAHKLDRLASALAKLTELERVSAGRPLPGSLRPSRATAAKPRGVAPVLPE